MRLFRWALFEKKQTHNFYSVQKMVGNTTPNEIFNFWSWSKIQG